MKNLRITIRLEEKDRERIEQLVNEGRAKNISQVIRTALEQFLKSKANP